MERGEKVQTAEAQNKLVKSERPFVSSSHLQLILGTLNSPARPEEAGLKNEK